MGANQVILVRTAAAKAKIPADLRDGLVLLVEESKGLEFDDVLILCVGSSWTPPPAQSIASY